MIYELRFYIEVHLEEKAHSYFMFREDEPMLSDEWGGLIWMNDTLIYFPKDEYNPASVIVNFNAVKLISLVPRPDKKK